jgi:hypothetical protein
MLHDMEPDDDHADARSGRRLSVVDLLTLGVVGLTLLVGAWVLVVMRDPYGSFNPMPPPPPPTEVTVVPYQPPGETQLPSFAMVPTSSATATLTQQAIDTIVPPAIPTYTPSATATLRWTPTPSHTPAAYAYTLEGEAVGYMQNTGENGCAWQSIAGRVLDLNREPVPGLLVHISGAGVDEMVVTGSQSDFGPGGYELPLGTALQRGQYVVQLIGQDGATLSDEVLVETIDRCEQNIALVNFVQNR